MRGNGTADSLIIIAVATKTIKIVDMKNELSRDLNCYYHSWSHIKHNK